MDTVLPGDVGETGEGGGGTGDDFVPGVFRLDGAGTHDDEFRSEGGGGGGETVDFGGDAVLVGGVPQGAAFDGVDACGSETVLFQQIAKVAQAAGFTICLDLRHPQFNRLVTGLGGDGDVILLGA
ncbi:MAG: hypothetical protein LUE17_14875 [Planctomycetaceae bacterium]|nr:hypothetical protein [Planctomycetaceae bacterium]